ncbi:hypothetical protein KTO58_19015 [Chitinophaga pendula]|uniref:hypothetical protein n=1 Tax=Chitinophaga TaxID=79328 RepID=UPI000BAF2C56|nr:MULTISPECIES: hypothetical protein [Chitinophaga]ASZ11237.1 hypothetical protein CK934_09800 [Chitinophaga sp. MD30]UCJ05766.1 hypothetical protein KTO58_19015 [Chitinophaga pendula]
MKLPIVVHRSHNLLYSALAITALVPLLITILWTTILHHSLPAAILIGLLFLLGTIIVLLPLNFRYYWQTPSRIELSEHTLFFMKGNRHGQISLSQVTEVVYYPGTVNLSTISLFNVFRLYNYCTFHMYNGAKYGFSLVGINREDRNKLLDALLNTCIRQKIPFRDV